MDVWFLRHGRSLADDEDKMEGRYDSPLTDVGRAQAKKRAAGWAEQEVQFDRVISSTLVRASETAEIIGAALGCPVETNPDWMEIDNGPMAGLPRKEGMERYPMPEFFGPYYKIAGVCESPVELQGRAFRALQSVVAYGTGRYLIVSHGGILNSVMRCIVGAAPQVNFSGVFFRFQDNGFLETSYSPERHRWTIRRFDPGVE